MSEGEEIFIKIGEKSEIKSAGDPIEENRNVKKIYETSGDSLSLSSAKAYPFDGEYFKDSSTSSSSVSTKKSTTTLIDKYGFVASISTSTVPSGQSQASFDPRIVDENVKLLKKWEKMMTDLAKIDKSKWKQKSHVKNFVPICFHYFPC